MEAGELYRIEKGIYADTRDVTTLAVISTKYPEAIITLDSAFYYHGLTDVIPDEYYIATSKHARKLRDSRIKQIFVPDEILNLGVIVMYRRDAMFRIYDKERMLIELLSQNKDYAWDHFQWFILETFPLDVTDDYAVHRENLYKEKLCTRVFGYNKN